MKIEAEPGDVIGEVARRACVAAMFLRAEVSFVFNGTMCVAKPWDTPDSIVAAYVKARSGSPEDVVKTLFYGRSR